MGVTEWVLIAILSVFWGGSFFFVGVAVREMTPLTLVLCRVGLAAITLHVVVLVKGLRMPTSWRVWQAFLVMGALNNLIPFSLIVWGQQYIDSSLAAILNAATPIFGVVIAHFFTGEEKLTANRGAGVLIGWAGVTVLIGVDALGGLGLHVLGQCAVVAATFFYACAAVFGRRFKGLPPIVVATGMLTGTTVMLLPLVAVFEQPLSLSPSLVTWGAIGGLALVSTAMAFIIYFRILASAGATNILLVTFLIPVSALALGVFVLGESPGWNAFAGMLLIFAGLILIDGRVPKSIAHRWPLARTPRVSGP